MHQPDTHPLNSFDLSELIVGPASNLAHNANNDHANPARGAVICNQQ